MKLELEAVSLKLITKYEASIFLYVTLLTARESFGKNAVSKHIIYHASTNNWFRDCHDPEASLECSAAYPSEGRSKT